MGAQHGSPKLDHELRNEDIELIKSKCNMQIYDICKWYNAYYQFAHGKQLNEDTFVRQFMKILPYDGDSENFSRLAFHGKNPSFI